MKRRGNLYSRLVSWHNLLHACDRAARGKRFRPDVAEFLFNVESELLQLQTELTDKTYHPGPYRSFLIYEPKQRQISAADFRDRVVHHALCRVIEPIFERRFSYDSYACRRFKGIHAAVNRCQHYLRRFRYVLKADVRKFFPTIDHEILKRRIAGKIKDPDVQWLVGKIIDGSNPQEPFPVWFSGDELFTPLWRRHGLPIGNQTSQFFANVYLDGLDHFIKEDLRMPGYARYVDDFLVFHDDRRVLARVRRDIEQYLASLRLKLHQHKSVVFPSEQGVKFLGYKVFPEYRRLTRDNVKRMKRRLQKMQGQFARHELPIRKIVERVECWIAHANHADTYRLRERLLSDFPFCRPSTDNMPPNGE